MCSHVSVGGGSEPFSSQADDVESLRQLVEEAWMTLTHNINKVPCVSRSSMQSIKVKATLSS